MVEPGTNKPVYTNKVTLRLKRDELMYDIRNIAYVEGDIMPAADEHERHQVMDIAEDGNVDRVSRIISLAVAHCREVLFPYSKVDVDSSEERDDTLETPDEYVIDLKVPKDFSKTTVDYLAKLIHELIVYRVLSDWLSITDIRNGAAAQNWAAKAEAVEDDIESTLNARIRRVRRTLNPF